MATYRFGKHPPKVDYRTLRLRSYLTAAIPAPPASYNVLTKVYTKLNMKDPTKVVSHGWQRHPGRLHHCCAGARRHGISRAGPAKR